MRRILLAAGIALLLAGCSSSPAEQPAASALPEPAPTVTTTVTAAAPEDPAAPLTNLDAYGICRIVGSQTFQFQTDPDEIWHPYEEAHFDGLPDGRIGVYSQYRSSGQLQDAASYCVVSGTEGAPVVVYTTVLADLDAEIGLNRYNLYLGCQADATMCP